MPAPARWSLLRRATWISAVAPRLRGRTGALRPSGPATGEVDKKPVTEGAWRALTQLSRAPFTALSRGLIVLRRHQDRRTPPAPLGAIGRGGVIVV